MGLSVSSVRSRPKVGSKRPSTQSTEEIPWYVRETEGHLIFKKLRFLTQNKTQRRETEVGVTELK